MPAREQPLRRERKKAETRRAIADAALRLFALRGFDAVTVTEVAEAADVSAKTVFNHFAAKELLFFEHEPLLSGDLAEVVRSRWPGEPLLTALIRIIRTPPGPDLPAFARVYRDSAGLRAYGRELFAAHEHALANVLTQGTQPHADASRGDAPRGDAAHGVVARGDVANGDAARGVQARGVQARGVQARGVQVRGADGMAGEMPILAAAAVGPLRQVWESILLEAADGTPPGEAVARGLNALEEAFSLLGGAFESAVSRRHRVQGPSAGEPPRNVRAERPSIMRVAELAGVSATTVSHTLNGRRPVAEETRRRVLSAIDHLGYRPNVLARGLRTNRSQTIGLIIPDITNPFYPALARGMQDVLGPAGYDQIISNTDGDRATEQAAIEQMIARQVDGLAFAVFHTHAEDLLPAIEAGIPVVRLGGRLVQPGVDLVHSDDEGGAAEATRYLLGQGYGRIAFICGPAAEGPAAERVAGYRTALIEAGLVAVNSTDSGRDATTGAGLGTGAGARAGLGVDASAGAVAGGGWDLVVHTDFSRAGGAEGVARVLEWGERPDAVLCANDIMAIGALDALAQRGLRAPDDLAVMGFDDIDAAGMVSPGLTTMANPAREIGRASARRLLSRLSGSLDAASTELVVPAQLIRRQSA
ncbi:substrate-binding domain-containing protein [Nonomuraea sp. NPDC050790]|uniref:substrate-binding domain-containing protein n=1 Tax=Nonomuraea sp. NPDC050790 TaxID=3364371 RepID=UPI0037A0BD60